jgi:Na+-transporting NADH:ubiquinone oxidoreductase subunit NqrE
MEESRKEVEKQMAKEVEKRVEEGVTTGITILIQVAISFGITVVVLKFVWAWVVEDLFPGAVAQGLINADLTWLASLKFAVLVAVLSGVYSTLIEAFKRQ